MVATAATAAAAIDRHSLLDRLAGMCGLTSLVYNLLSLLSIRLNTLIVSNNKNCARVGIDWKRLRLKL